MDVKEGAMDTVIETNYCTGQMDEDSAGIDSRASGTTIRYNKVVGCKGAGVRLGGHKVGSDQYGIACKVRLRAVVGVVPPLAVVFGREGPLRVMYKYWFVRAGDVCWHVARGSE